MTDFFYPYKISAAMSITDFSNFVLCTFTPISISASRISLPIFYLQVVLKIIVFVFNCSPKSISLETLYSKIFKEDVVPIMNLLIGMY